MALCNIYLQSESAYSILAALGEMELVEFRELNDVCSHAQRKFSNEVKLCEETEKKLEYLLVQTRKEHIVLKDYTGVPPAPSPRQMIDLMIPGTADFDLLRKLYNEVREVSYAITPLKSTLQLHMEYQAILKKSCSLLYSSTVTSIHDPELGQQNLSDNLGVEIIGGVLPRQKWQAFETALWRICHGNYLLQFSDIETKSQLDFDRRTLFVVLIHGEVLINTVKKLAIGFSAMLYTIPDSKAKCLDLYSRNKSEIADLIKVIATTNEQYMRVLKVAAHNLKRWMIQVMKMKSIYNTMNMFNVDASETCLIAECWLPVSNLPLLNDLFLDETLFNYVTDVKPIIIGVSYSEEPPTFFRLNKFTKGFQNIIDAYGIANYKELNPMPYTVITFPFLFAVMFGDVGHGIIMTLFASIIILYEKELIAKDIHNEIWKIMFGGRYIILLMGIASIYTGAIYNDFFAIQMNIFGTSWKVNYEGETVKENKELQLHPGEDFTGVPYPFGMDPAWKLALNQIDFYNSFKMKISIILGVTQMWFGIWLGLLNLIYFRNYLSIFCEFIPELLFFTSLFGYLVFLIFFKWLTYGPTFDTPHGTSCAPAIIITFISMILFTDNKVTEGCDKLMYNIQERVQNGLVLLAAISIPWMLILKPAISMGLAHRRRTRALRHSSEVSGVDLIISRESTCKISQKEHRSDAGEIIIHQCIHTIEFVLGSVSYTASYLRLWALSLAHSQLAEVLWHMVFVAGLNISSSLGSGLGAIPLYIIFCFWAALTIAILVVMEGLSAFLHALRLHWMEFQSKFYSGQGYLFSPFSFREFTEEIKGIS